MKKTILTCGLLLLSAFGLAAQTAETIPFLAFMESKNEVPPVPEVHSGYAVILLHVVFDAQGAPVSGSVDFDITTRFAPGTALTVTGLHIHSAAAGVNGGIVVPTDVNNSNNSIAIDDTGRLRIQKQVQFPAANVTLATISGILANPQNYYVNIHTTVNGGGAMRGQMMAAEGAVLMGLMSTQNEVPPVNATGSAVGSVQLLRARNSAGAVQMATAIFNVDYTGLAAGTTFTGLHVHNGIAGVNGGVVINTGLNGTTNTLAADPSGTGNVNLPVYMTPLDANFAAEVATVNGLFSTPQNHYINIHTTQFGGGIMRDQMRPTEVAVFKVNLSPANEVPPIAGLTASAVTQVIAFVARNPDGTAATGAVLFDVNYRGFPAPTTFTGLHVHRGAADANGGVVIPAGVDANAGRVVTETGSGNIFKIVNINTPAALTALNDLLANPNGFYENIHTTVNGGGAARAQLTAALARATVGGVANNASTITTVAPGSVISIYGANLSPVFSGLSGFAAGLTALPQSLNGVSVTIGGVRAPVYFVSGGQINVQVPFSVAVGTQPVVVTTSAGASTAFNVVVAAAAPSIFIVDGAGTGAVVKNVDFSLITADNRARAGDTIVIYSTGLGQTTPAVDTGVLVVPPAGAFNNTGTVTVTIGGQNAAVVYSIASPGFAGLYQTAVTVPSGLTGSSAPLILRSGTTASNTVNIAIQ